MRRKPGKPAPRKIQGEQEFAVAEAFLSGEKLGHITKRLRSYGLKVSNTAVENALRRRGVYKPSRKLPHEFTDTERRQIVDMYLNKELSSCDIAKSEDIDPSSVHNILIKAKVKMRRKLRSRTLNLPTDSAVIGYLAGIIDGEGNIFAWLRPGRRLQTIITVINTNEALLNWLKHLGGRLQWRNSDVGHFGKKRVGSWVINRRLDVEPLLEAVLPYLIVKKTDAIKALDEIEKSGY
jgi:hypothetical protein